MLEKHVKPRGNMWAWRKYKSTNLFHEKKLCYIMPCLMLIRLQEAAIPEGCKPPCLYRSRVWLEIFDWLIDWLIAVRASSTCPVVVQLQAYVFTVGFLGWSSSGSLAASCHVSRDAGRGFQSNHEYEFNQCCHELNRVLLVDYDMRQSKDICVPRPSRPAQFVQVVFVFV